jgi:hypothetical protein
VGSAWVTVVACFGVGVVVTALVGAVVLFVDLAFTDPTAAADAQTGLPPWVFSVLLAVVLTTVCATGCRVGLGSPGDAYRGLRCVGPDGEPAGARRQWARSAAYVVPFGLLAVVDHAGLGALVVVLLWLPSLVRRDRRSLVDLAVGVSPHSPVLGGRPGAPRTGPGVLG